MATLARYDELLMEVKPRPIRTKADYRRVLKQLDELMEPHPPRERGMMIDLLAALVEQYEAAHFPAPQKLSPAKYLAELMEARGLSQAEVSRSTGIPRSVLSNTLAGRRAVSKATALRLTKFFGVPVHLFLEAPE